MVDFYRDLIKSENCEVRIFFSNDAKHTKLYKKHFKTVIFITRKTKKYKRLMVLNSIWFFEYE